MITNLLPKLTFHVFSYEWLIDLNFYIKKMNNPKPLHYTRRITPNPVTSLRCPSPRHGAEATQQLIHAIDCLMFYLRTVALFQSITKAVKRLH